LWSAGRRSLWMLQYVNDIRKQMGRLCAVVVAEVLKLKSSMQKVFMHTLIVGQQFKAWNIEVF